MIFNQQGTFRQYIELIGINMNFVQNYKEELLFNTKGNIIKSIEIDMINQVLWITALVVMINCLKLTPLIQLRDEQFYEKAAVDYDKQTGKVSSRTNAMIYFFISGEQSNQIVQRQKAQFQNTVHSYLKALHKYSLQKSQLPQQILEEDPVPQAFEQIYNQSNQSQEKKLNLIQFYSVKCSNDTQINQQKQKITEDLRSICQLLGLSSNVKSRLIFFTEISQFIEFTEQIKEEHLIYFISKVKENLNPSSKTFIFDQELSKIAAKFQIEQISFQQKTIGFFKGLRKYLTWDALKYFIIFFVVPFLFGYVSTKLQQRANRQRIKKYQTNLEEQPKLSEKKKKLSKQEKQKVN